MFVEAHSRLSERLSSVIQEGGGVALDAYEVLAALAAEPEGRIRLSELADRIVLSKSGLTRRLDRMEKSDLVRREGCSEDRRGSFAVLTEKGREAWGAAWPKYRETVRKHFGDRMTEGEARQLGAVMKRVLDSLEK
jgi:DNA-binding MarR family transcriptional regulator